MKESEKIALQQRFGFATQRDAATQLGMWCVPTMAERERERKTREGRREERKKEGRAHPPPPRPGGPLPPHRPFQPVHPFWVASLSHTRSAPTGPHPTRILNGCGERETGQGTTNGRTRHTPVLYRRSRIAYHLMKPGINNSEDLELGSNFMKLGISSADSDKT